MKLAFTSFLILMSASLASFANGGSFSFKSGHFDSKHFSSRSQASLEFSGDQVAHLKIVGGTSGIQSTNLDQTFPFVQVRTDACNVRFFESGSLPARRAVHKLSAGDLMMAKVEIRDARTSTCLGKATGLENQSIEITVHTKTATSVGTSTLQFDAIQTDLAFNSSRRTRAPALLIKGESTLVDLTSL